MDVTDQLALIETAHVAGDRGRFGQVLSELIHQTSELPPDEQLAALELITSHFDHERADLAAHLAMATGAMVEMGAPPEVPARAITGPITRHLKRAAEFITFAESAPAAKDGEPEGLWLESHAISQATFAQLQEKHPEHAASLRSLEVWYRPVVALWSRCRVVLKEQRDNAALRDALARVGNASSAHWIAVLLGDTFHDRFVVLLPETNEGFDVVLDGVCDCGQLTVLFAAEVALDSIGITSTPSSLMLSVMRGDGPQQSDSSYASDLHFYAWKAMNPETRMPERDRYTWHAPGGSGSHSLPSDFQPSAIEEIDGRRVLLLVGPRSGAAVFQRGIPGTRSFGAQSATIEATPLSPTDVERWINLVQSACQNVD